MYLNLNDIKKWIVDNPEKLLGGITALSGIGATVIWLKLNNIEKKVGKNDYSIGFLDGARKLANDVHDIVIKRFGEQEGQKILDIIADEIEKL